MTEPTPKNGSARSNADRRRTGARWAVRGAATAVAAVIAVAAIGAAHVAGSDDVTGHPAGRTVTPVAADAQRVCAGSTLRLADDTGADATQASSVGTATVASATTGSTVERSRLESSSTGSSDPTLLTAPAGRSTPQVAGTSYQSVADGDLQGVVAASCDDAATSTWLVGGSTETGRTSLITLSNPTDVNATVDLSVYDAGGTVNAPGMTGIVVAPNSQKVVPLSGFVSGQASTVVHVESSGGQIVAHMQESVVRTLTAGGVDIVSGGAGPSRSQVVPAVVLDGADKAQQGDDTADAAPAVRLFVPGSRAARVTLGITTSKGGGTTVNTTAEPGVVTDVPLDDFPDGTYSLTVSSTRPVVAGARTSSPTEDGRTDLGWFASAEPLTATTTTNVVDGDGASLSFVNPTTEDARITVRGAEGDQHRYTLASGAMTTVKVATSEKLTITGAKGMVAGVTYKGADGIAGYPVRPSTAVSSPVTVYP